jgi:hypothetical protein
VTVYWVTIALVLYLTWLARATDPRLDARAAGKLPEAVSSRAFLGAAGLVLVAVAALRWGVGTDFFQYVDNYQSYKSSFFSDFATLDEPGIKSIAWVVSHLKDDAAVFMASTSIITVGLILWTITRYSNALIASFLLFIFVGSWHGTFNGIRQYLACAIVFAGHRLIMERKLLRYLLVVVLASLFHISALATLALYFVPNRRLAGRTIALLAVGALAILYLSDTALVLVEAVRGEIVITEYTTRNVNPLRVAVAVVPVLLYWTRGVRVERDSDWFYRNMMVVHAVVVLAASWSAYLTRFGIYTSVFLPLVIPRLIDFPDRRLTAVARVAVVLMYAAYWYVAIATSANLSNFRWMTGRLNG